MSADVVAGGLFLFLFSMIPVLVGIGVVLLFIGLPLAFMTIRFIYEYERGILFTFGKYSKTLQPGLRIIIPIIQEMRKVDQRITTVDIPKQEVMTKDNVPVRVDAVLYFKVVSPEDAVLQMQDYVYAIAKYSQTALRDVVGNVELDTLLTQRDQIADEIEKGVEKETIGWGIDVTAIKLQDVELPADMKRAMARQAEAERERRATITLSEGEKAAADNIMDAAKKLGTTPGALHLRTLQTLSDVSFDQSNTIVFVTPIEVLRAIEGVGDIFNQTPIVKKTTTAKKK